jgi:hypothetical protein
MECALLCAFHNNLNLKNIYFYAHFAVRLSINLYTKKILLLLISGPVTVPMVSQSGSPPIPMTVQVPPGHVMQQIVDENGTLRHVFLSTQHQQMQSGVQGVQQHHIHGHGHYAVSHMQFLLLNVCCQVPLIFLCWLGKKICIIPGKCNLKFINLLSQKVVLATAASKNSIYMQLLM